MIYQYKTVGFVFKEENVAEASRFFSVFTRDFGRVEIFGKAIRKITSKLRGGIDIFSMSEIEFVQGRNKKILTGSSAEEKFKNIKNNLEKIKITCNVASMLDDFIGGEEKDDKIWILITDFFKKLNDEKLKCDDRLMYCYFFWNFIGALGYSPEVSVCVFCGRLLNPENIYFSSKEGGIICGNCLVGRDRFRISKDVVKILRIIIQKKWNILSVLRAGEDDKNILKMVSDNYRNYLLFNCSRGISHKNF